VDTLEQNHWIELCKRHAHEEQLSDVCIQVLRAFGSSATQEPSAPNFQQLQENCATQLDLLPGRIVATLDGEIDKDQAQLFSRRFQSVIELLEKQAAMFQEAVLLKTGLIIRTHQILNAPGPRALRVRAVVDFYYTQAAIIHHRPEDPSLVQNYQTLIDQTPWQDLGNGASWKKVEGLTQFGPIHVNVLKLTQSRIRAVDCRTHASGLSLEDFAAAQNALAAVSGGFFLYSEPDIQPPSIRTDPVSFLMDQGTIYNPPVLCRATLMQTQSGATSISRVGPQGLRFRWEHGPILKVESHNRISDANVRSFNRAFGRVAPAGPTNVAIVGNTVVSVSKGELEIPLAGLIVSLTGIDAPEPGTPIQWLGYESFDHDPLHTAMAGGPLLLEQGAICINREVEDFQESAPPVTFSQDETFDQNLLPRMAAGLNEAGVLFFAAIDGRNFHQAPGMTLKQTAEWMKALGCHRAMNLDGGSSKRMVVNQKVVDLSSTEVVGAKVGKESIRPVHSAILIDAES
jgi:exopolysaccharide biosynthesis protein